MKRGEVPGGRLLVLFRGPSPSISGIIRESPPAPAGMIQVLPLIPGQLAIFSSFSRMVDFSQCESGEVGCSPAVGSSFGIGEVTSQKRIDQKEVMPDRSPGLRVRPASQIENW